MTSFQQTDHMADDPRGDARESVRAGESLWAELRAGSVSRVLPLGWSVAARRVLRKLDRLLRRANDAAENALLAVVRDPESDPDFRKTERGARGLLRLERVWAHVRRRRRELDYERAVLADPERRAALREALGGDAALARWDAAWEAARARGDGVAKLSRRAPGVVNVSAKPKPRSRETGRERVRGGSRREQLRETFRLASRPRLRRAARRGRKTSRSNTTDRDMRRGARRIPVWPEELRAQTGPVPSRGRQVWTHGPERGHAQCAGGARGSGCRSP